MNPVLKVKCTDHVYNVPATSWEVDANQNLIVTKSDNSGTMTFNATYWLFFERVKNPSPRHAQNLLGES